MDVKQIYSIMNDVTKEVLGETALINEDLSNIVEIGDAVFNANAKEKYCNALINRIGKTIFVNRAYNGGVPSVLMDAWEFGSILQKVDAEIPDAEINDTWNLVDGASYDPHIFKAPKVNVKFYNGKVTFDIQMSFVDEQIKQSFLNVNELNAFVSMLYNAIDKSMTIKTDKLIMMTIANFIGETLYDYDSTGTYTTGGVRAINLLYLYNDMSGESLTKDDCLYSLEFLKFASYTMMLYAERMTKISKLFNIGGRAKFTPRDLLHIVCLSDFAHASDVYLQSDTYHNEMVKLPNGIEVVPYWQASGLSYAFDDVSKIHITTKSGHEIETDGILAVMFDRDALGVANFNRRTTSEYNPRAEFINMWFKMDAQYFNDENEQFILFYVK